MNECLDAAALAVIALFLSFALGWLIVELFWEDDDYDDL